MIHDQEDLKLEIHMVINDWRLITRHIANTVGISHFSERLTGFQSYWLETLRFILFVWIQTQLMVLYICIGQQAVDLHAKYI